MGYLKFSSFGDVQTSKLIDCYEKNKEFFDKEIFEDLDVIFDVAKRNREFFPTLSVPNDNLDDYIFHWIKSYSNAYHNRPSKRNAMPKGACTDPAIRVIVQNSQGLSDAEAIIGEKTHNLFMSAENIQGSLLEEYIESKIHDYGFIWCMGNTLTAIDFCNSTGSFFLQIKNKSNTENSSSNKIREGKPIEKWYRLGSRKNNGIIQPVYRWDVLNELVREHGVKGNAGISPSMSEADYQSFLENVAKNNTNLITEK